MLRQSGWTSWASEVPGDGGSDPLRCSRAFVDRQPALAARIEEAAREKLGHALNAQGGDIVTEELYEAPSD